jgi:8-oxo-dGTP pyrophosphatase MutT (NUDIX family)
MEPSAPEPTGTPEHESTGRSPARRQRVSVYGICEDGDGRVLLVRAAPYLTVAGRWFLPGGGIDHGEDPVAALRREFSEETGLKVEIGELRGVLSDVQTLPDGTLLHTVRIVYGIDSYAGELRDELDGSSDAARWHRVDELADLALVPYALRALTELR